VYVIIDNQISNTVIYTCIGPTINELGSTEQFVTGGGPSYLYPIITASLFQSVDYNKIWH
jgi:hypothetical protein